MSVIELGTKINRGTGKTNFTYFRDVSGIKKTLQQFRIREGRNVH